MHSTFMKTFSPLNDSDLIRAVTSDNPREVNQALSYLYKEFYRMNYILCSRMNLPGDAYKDVLQNSTIVLWTHLLCGTYKSSACLKTFFYSIMKNQCHNELKRRRFEINLPELPVSEERLTATVEEDYIKKQDMEIVRACVKDLRAPYKKTFEYFYYKDRSLKYIAGKEKAASEDVIKYRKFRGMKLLRKSYFQSL